MSRQVANVDIITDSFEVWLLKSNELLHALSTEIITANTTYVKLLLEGKELILNQHKN